MAVAPLKNSWVGLGSTMTPAGEWWRPAPASDVRVHVAAAGETPTHTLTIDGKQYALVIDVRDELVPESTRRDAQFWEDLKVAAAHAALGIAMGIATVCVLKVIAITFA